MAITLTTQKTKPVQAPKSVAKIKSPATVAAEEMLHIYQRLLADDAFVMMKKYEELKKSLQSIAADSGASTTEPYVFKTDFGTITFSPTASVTKITDKAKMIELLGDEVFAKVATVTLGDLGKYLSANELEQITEKIDGSRKLVSVLPANSPAAE